MKIDLALGAANEVVADLLVIPVAEGAAAGEEAVQSIDSRLDGILARVAEDAGFTGKSGQHVLVHTHGKVSPHRVMLLGMGSEEPRTAGAGASGGIRAGAAAAVRAAKDAGARRVAIHLGSHATTAAQMQAAVEGALLGRYRFGRYFSEKERGADKLEAITFVTRNAALQKPFEGALRRAEVIARAVAGTRDMVNEPAGELTPTRMAELAVELGKERGLEVKVLGPRECRELGMGMFLGVAAGATEEPRFIHMTYKPKGASRKRIVLIGKAVTFDSGGLSLKPSASMLDMKIDMAGGAAVIHAICALADLGVPYEIHAIAAATENMLSGSSYKLGDVLRSMAGTTVEINNTDAEGRLTLGDAMTYARRLEPDEMFDFATLTGACMVALGPTIAGVMSNDDALCERWLASAAEAGEDMWRLPLHEKLKEQLKSDIADMKNTGGRLGGAITAGLFLKEFAGSTPWVHVDLAGPAAAEKESGHVMKGGTGFGVATIVHYLSA